MRTDNASFERKFTAPAHLADFGLSWLQHVCVADAQYSEGHVNSVYFDDKAMSSFREKDNSDFLKTKIRLRWYSESLQSNREVFLETKQRAGRTRVKRRLKLKVDSDWLSRVALESGAVEDYLRKEAGDLSYCFHRNIAAMATTVYQRHRFVCSVSGARVCLDTDIHSDRINSRYLPFATPCRLNTIVLEIKGPSRSDLPWLGQLYKRGFRERSFSKYYECIARSTEGEMTYEHDT